MSPSKYFTRQNVVVTLIVKFKVRVLDLRWMGLLNCQFCQQKLVYFKFNYHKLWRKQSSTFLIFSKNKSLPLPINSSLNTLTSYSNFSPSHNGNYLLRNWTYTTSRVRGIRIKSTVTSLGTNNNSFVSKCC